MDVILLSRDLMLLARTQGAANQLGIRLRNANSVAQASEFVADGATLGVVIDLRTPGLNIQATVSDIRASRPNNLIIAACGPHVHEGALQAAREAGCDVVATRGQFDRDAEAILGAMIAS